MAKRKTVTKMVKPNPKVFKPRPAEKCYCCENPISHHVDLRTITTVEPHVQVCTTCTTAILEVQTEREVALGFRLRHA